MAGRHALLARMAIISSFPVVMAPSVILTFAVFFPANASRRKNHAVPRSFHSTNFTRGDPCAKLHPGRGGVRQDGDIKMAPGF